MKFEEMNLEGLLLKGLKAAGYDEPTEVQSKCIPLCLQGKDIIVQSKTGSGKTAGFGVPLLQKCQGDGIEGVILVPTRELAVQVFKEIELLGKFTKFRSIPVYGGTSIQNQINDLYRKSIIVATPGRFIDLHQRGQLNLKKVHTVILDEADRMLDMGFEQDIRYILSLIPRERQTLLFSATMPGPIQKIAHNYMRSPEKLLLSKDEISVDTIIQTYYGTSDQKKLETLGYILDVEKPDLAIVFCNTKRSVDFVERVLRNSGYNAAALHGDLTQGRRDRVIRDFKDRNIHILVASDVAARGLHIDDITHVINYDLPIEADIYVHRIGRTGRAGNSGKAINIVTMSDSKMFDAIRRKINKDIIREEINPKEFRPHIKLPPRPEGGFRRSFGGNRGGGRGGPRRPGGGGHRRFQRR